MTRYEAALRAVTIWGKTVALMPAQTKGAWWVDVGDDGANGHYLDGNGHATCHPACARLEEDVYAPLRGQ